MLTCSTVVKFAYSTYVIIERHLNITQEHRTNSNYNKARKHGAYRSMASL